MANLAVQIPKGVVGVLANIVPGYFAMTYPNLRFHICKKRETTIIRVSIVTPNFTCPYSTLVSDTAAVGFAFAGSTALLLAPRVPGLLGAVRRVRNLP